MLQSHVAIRTSALTVRLREATAALRDDRELLAGRVSWLDYRLYLVQMYGFHAGLERALAAVPLLAAVVPDAGLRNHKSALLAHDLVALGVDRRDLALVPRMPVAAPLALPEALGWTYVVESGTVPSKALARRLARQLPNEVQGASAYLNCYGDEAPERWRELGAALDAYAESPPPAAAPRAGKAAARAPSRAEPASATPQARDDERVIEAACDGFLRLRGWLRAALPAPSSRIRA